MSSAFKIALSSDGLRGAALNKLGGAGEATKGSDEAKGGKGFGDFLRESVDEVNKAHHTADKMATDLATGKSENIHETMLALSQAEIGFKLMVQVRNKALEAYQEVMRMPV